MSTTSYDAIVVGARVAGASTAMLLARRGYRVLLLDRTRFPCDIPHGHMIHKDGPHRLKAWGLLDRLADAGTPPVDTVTTHFGDFPLTARDLSMDGIAWGYGARRRLVDAILLEAAIAAGAEFREGVSVDDVSWDGDRVVGISGHAGSIPVSERAKVVIGADGRHSRVARAVKAPALDETPPLLCYYFSYWHEVPSEGMEIYDANRRVVFAHPTSEGLFAVFVGWPMDCFALVRADIEREFMAVVDSFPGLGERLRAGKRDERFYGAADLANVRRRAAGNGWALVGDAGCHKDPYMVLGMADALRDAELLADAVDHGLAGATSLGEALAGYEQRRDEASVPEYRQNIAFARLNPPPADFLALRSALKGDAEQTRRFWMARVGMTPLEAFFNPDNLARLMGRTGRPSA